MPDLKFTHEGLSRTGLGGYENILVLCNRCTRLLLERVQRKGLRRLHLGRGLREVVEDQH